ncbi:MAG: flagellar biosynthesis protein FlhF [Stenotrophomonas nitritireducens]|uniref:flagellar biosynthesis protein FlhF n=1 Tax=Stenotrophomonas nitritireducens TaxID=83617 RepID=UPI001ACF2FE0|nr:flagellar biosynthesis protein FlhF [Stenotrophomonas nitritireducens]MBN8768901.1 flagellar biosynthesis protein FlhF [Stenotrophomonas sp.]MBN8792939.1 flagellar biosynthesis protein FlhF [Stenotrophomonas nitritireducens]
MKIKRFVAADMRTAMNLVRKEHGPDAVILSNRRIEEGVEIVAAAHYDETAVQRALEAARPAPPAPKPRSAAEAIIAAVTRRRTPEPEPVVATASAVAALARSAVGATGRSIDSSVELAPGSRFSSLLKPQPRPAAERLPELPEQIFATFPAALDDTPVVPAFRPEGFAPVEPAPPAPAPVNRARFVIDPPLQEPVALAPAPAPRIEPPMAPPAPLEMAPLREAPVEPILPVAPAVAATVNVPAPAPETAVAAPALSVVATAPRDDRQLAELRQEVAGMRQLIEREMNRFTDERLRGSPVRANALDLMDEYGFDAGLARDVAVQMPAETDPARARGLMLGLISKKLPIAPVDPIEAGGVIALVGPTGAGKTTTIAKLASRFAEAHAARDVALVTTDTQRIGAREQLYGFGRQLGIAVHEASSGTNLNQLLERLADYKLVLIDTAGLGQRDRALTAQLQWLRAAGQIRTLLVLPANTSFQDMDEVVRRFGAANPQGLVLTKLDETGRFGSALSVAVDHHLPITWVTDGQDVPEDLHRASAANLVLRLEDLRRAADMPCNPELNHAVA